MGWDTGVVPCEAHVYFNGADCSFMCGVDGREVVLHEYVGYEGEGYTLVEESSANYVNVELAADEGEVLVDVDCDWYVAYVAVTCARELLSALMRCDAYVLEG